MTKPLFLCRCRLLLTRRYASLLVIWKCFDLSSVLTQLFIVSCVCGYSSRLTENNQDTFWQHLSEEKTSMTWNLSHIRITISKSPRCELDSSNPTSTIPILPRKWRFQRPLVVVRSGRATDQTAQHSPKAISLDWRPCGQVWEEQEEVAARRPWLNMSAVEK